MNEIQTALECSICNKTKVQLLGEGIRFRGMKDNNEFVSAPMKIYRCNTCGHMMFFDNDVKGYPLKPYDPMQ